MPGSSRVSRSCSGARCARCLRYTARQHWAQISAEHTLHELGPISNICADWGQILLQGLLGRRQVAEATRSRLADDLQAVEFLDCALETIDAVLVLAAAYAAEARRQGRTDLAEILERVPA